MAVSEMKARLGTGEEAELRANRAQSFRQPIASALPAIGRALAGIALAGGFAAITTPGAWAIVALSGLAGLFALYAARTLARHMSVITISEDEIAVSGLFGQHLRWSELDGVSLRYFSTRRDGENGWMNLVLRSGHARLTIESEHPAFEPAARRAFAAAARASLGLSPPTLANARALGITAPFSGSRA